MAKDNNDDNKDFDSTIEEAAEQFKNALNDLINKDKGGEDVPVDIEVTLEKDDQGKKTEKKDSKKKKISGKKKEAKDGSFGSIISIDQTLPVKLPLLALNGRPIFPGIFTPLMISNSDDVKTVEDAFADNGFIGLVLSKNESETPCVSDLYSIGTAARIIKKINLPDGGVNIFVSTIKRFSIKRTLSAKNPVVAVVSYLEDEESDTFETKALTRALISEMKEISDNNPLFSEEMRLNMVNIDNPGKIADFVASILNVDKLEQQKVLEETNIRSRLEQVLVFIKKEQELLRMQKKVQNELNEKIEKNQREYFLREEMKAIQDELGVGADGEGNDYSKFKAKIEGFKFEGEVKESVESELEKFKLMDPASSEYFVSRNYLELVCSLPWN